VLQAKADVVEAVLGELRDISEHSEAAHASEIKSTLHELICFIAYLGEQVGHEHAANSNTPAHPVCSTTSLTLDAPP